MRDYFTRLLVSVRSLFDRWLFFARYQRLFLASVVITVVELTLTTRSIVPIITIMFSVLLLVSDFLRSRADIRAYDLDTRGLTWIRQMISEREQERLLVANAEAFSLVLHTTESTNVLDGPATDAKHVYHLPDSLKAAAPSVILRRRDRATLLNRELLALAGDPGSGRPTLGRARYFDHLASNYAYRFHVRPHGDSRVDVTAGLMLDAAGDLLPLAASRCANVIGVSTIAFTSDNYLILVKPTERNLGSVGLFHPSGSGSAEWKDYADGDTLRQTLVKAVERELCEETGLGLEELQGTQILGYARWLNQAGKPEFFGVTRTNADARSLLERHQVGEEPIFTKRVTIADVHLSRINVEQRADSTLDLSHLPDDIHSSCSGPLAVALFLASSPWSTGPTGTPG